MIPILSSLVACMGPTTAPPEKPGLALHQDEASSERPVPTGPNVVLVLGCTVRRDQVGVYGATLETMPHLRALAARGVRFADPVVAAPWTRASSAAMLTGRYPLELGMVERGVRRNDMVLPEEAITLAERFRAAGYRTVGATANPNLNQVFGFSQGFDAYLEPDGLWRNGGARLPGEEVVERLEEVVGTPTDRPLYLQVMLVDAHAPYDHPVDPNLLAPGEPPRLGRYRVGIRDLDQNVGRLADMLERRGYRAEETLFVFVSDHGEGLSHPEHHGVGHGNYVYASSTEGVWVMAGPGIPAGSVIEGVTSQIDLGATLAGLARLPAPPPGHDQSPRLRGETPARSPAVVDTWFRGVSRAALYTDTWACMRSFSAAPEPRAPTGRFVPGCYDRRTDPEQRTPVLRPESTEMRDLEAWRAARPLTGGVRTSVSDELSEQLERLGYTE